MFCGCCKLSNYHSYATHIDIFYPICFTWQKVRVVGNISAALGFLKITAPWSSLRISCAAWHAAARLAARGRLLCSSVGPTRPPSPLSFSFVAVPMLKKYCSMTAKGGGSTVARPGRRAHTRAIAVAGVQESCIINPSGWDRLLSLIMLVEWQGTIDSFKQEGFF